jgi:hypothetical protein
MIRKKKTIKGQMRRSPITMTAIHCCSENYVYAYSPVLLAASIISLKLPNSTVGKYPTACRIENPIIIIKAHFTIQSLSALPFAVSAETI